MKHLKKLVAALEELLEPFVEEGTFVVLTGNAGTEIFPAAALNMVEVGKLLKTLQAASAVPLASTELGMISKNASLNKITFKRGFGAYLSSPDNLDRTDMEVFETSKEASAYLQEAFPGMVAVAD